MASRKHAPQPTLRTILNRIDAQGTVLNEHGAILNEHGAILRQHGAALERLGVKVDSLGGTVGSLGGRMDSLGGTVGSLGERMDSFEVKVDSQNLLLEDIRSQNRLTIEAVEATRVALEQRIDRLDQESRSRDAVLELAVRELKVSVQQNTIDIRDLAGKVEALTRLEERVAAIERRLA